MVDYYITLRVLFSFSFSFLIGWIRDFHIKNVIYLFGIGGYKNSLRWFKQVEHLPIAESMSNLMLWRPRQRMGTTNTPSAKEVSVRRMRDFKHS